MLKTHAATMSLVFSTCGVLCAGDAVAIGYNAEGVWTAVTYYNSSTPAGGTDYKTEAQAREEALRDLRARAGENSTNSKIIAASDSTGYAAVARGKNRAAKDENVVGYGKSQREADQNALAQLKQADAAGKRKIVYRYFSYGADSK